MNPTLAQKLAGFDPDRPLERAETIPADWYRDPEIAELERRAVFGDTWQAVGRAEQVAEPGSFLTAEVASEPVVVVRDEAGLLRAFSNVCRHRAAPVAVGPCGRASRLRCRYHGWTYDLAGRLRGTPEFDGVQDFRREDNGLPPLHVAVWGPFVWVHLGPQSPAPLNDWLAPLPARGLSTAGLVFAERREYLLACNWKVFVDNYLDGGYHINSVHPGLAGVVDYGRYHNEVGANVSLQEAPLRPAAAGTEAVAAVRPGGAAQYWWVFPNLMVNLYEGLMDTNLVLPLGPGRCRVLFDFYFAEGTPAAFIRDSIAVSDRIQQEDAGISEEVQHGLGSRFFRSGRFSVRREAPGHHFHQLLARRLLRASGGGSGWPGPQQCL
jgi:choline monooxygenase